MVLNVVCHIVLVFKNCIGDKKLNIVVKLEYRLYVERCNSRTIIARL